MMTRSGQLSNEGKEKNLIDLRDSLKNKVIRLMEYEQELIKENMELKESINNTTRRAM